MIIGNAIHAESDSIAEQSQQRLCKEHIVPSVA